MALIGLGAGGAGALFAVQLAGGPVPAALPAEPAPAAPPASADPAVPASAEEPGLTTEQFEAWAYQCESRAEGSFCYLSFALANKATGERLIQLFVEPDGEGFAATFDLPPDTDPLAGVTLTLGGQTLTAAPLGGCAEGRCAGRAALGAAFLDAMRAGGEAEAALSRAGQPRTHKISLAGFAAALAKLRP